MFCLRVALAFYGLTRSLHHTLDSIHRNVFDPIRAAGHTFDVYVHTYSLTELTNERSHEVGVTLNATEYKLLEPYAYKVDSQVRCAE